MSVVAWDGRTIAADKQMESGGKTATATKIRRISTGEVLAWTGSMEAGLTLARWYADGADVGKWPECQKDKDQWTRLIVASKSGVKFYEMLPAPIDVEDPFCAWGSGQDFATGAMAAGASARQAVLITSEFSTGCGRGVDVFQLTPQGKRQVARR